MRRPFSLVVDTVLSLAFCSIVTLEDVSDGDVFNGVGDGTDIGVFLSKLCVLASVYFVYFPIEYVCLMS